MFTHLVSFGRPPFLSPLSCAPTFARPPTSSDSEKAVGELIKAATASLTCISPHHTRLSYPPPSLHPNLFVRPIAPPLLHSSKLSSIITSCNTLYCLKLSFVNDNSSTPLSSLVPKEFAVAAARTLRAALPQPAPRRLTIAPARDRKTSRSCHAWLLRYTYIYIYIHI